MARIICIVGLASFLVLALPMVAPSEPGPSGQTLTRGEEEYLRRIVREKHQSQASEQSSADFLKRLQEERLRREREGALLNFLTDIFGVWGVRMLLAVGLPAFLATLAAIAVCRARGSPGATVWAPIAVGAVLGDLTGVLFVTLTGLGTSELSAASSILIGACVGAALGAAWASGGKRIIS